MIVCYFLNFDLGVEKEVITEWGDINFEMGGSGTCCTLVLRVQENFKQSLSLIFLWPRRVASKRSLDLHFYVLIIELFRSAVCLVSRVDYGFDQWSVVSFIIKKHFLYLLMVKHCVHLVIQMYLIQIYFHQYILGINLQAFFSYCLSTQSALKRKAKFREESKR